MTHYQDFKVKGGDIPIPVVMGEVFRRAHLRIVEVGVGKIGVTFPNLEDTPGDTLRLHGAEEDLTEFGTEWLKHLHLQVESFDIDLVPPNSTLKVLRRVQPRPSPERWLRRWLKRHGGQAPDTLPPRHILQAPFLRLRSSSNKNMIIMFFKVELDLTKGSPLPNSYGIGSALPHF